MVDGIGIGWSVALEFRCELKLARPSPLLNNPPKVLPDPDSSGTALLDDSFEVPSFSFSFLRNVGENASLSFAPGDTLRDLEFAPTESTESDDPFCRGSIVEACLGASFLSTVEGLLAAAKVDDLNVGCVSVDSGPSASFVEEAVWSIEVLIKGEVDVR